MSKIVVYDPTNAIVANKVTVFNASANAPDYDEVTEKLVDPDLSLLWVNNTYLVPIQYWKYDGVSAIVEMNQSEKDLVDASGITSTAVASEYQAMGRNYRTILSTQKWYPAGKQVTRLYCLLTSNKPLSYAVLKITVGSTVREVQTTCTLKNIATNLCVDITQNIVTEQFQTVTIEAKAKHNSRITISDLYLEVI